MGDTEPDLSGDIGPAAGVTVATALPVGLWRSLVARGDLRLHRKIVVIDGELGYTGSLNLVDPRHFKAESCRTSTRLPDVSQPGDAHPRVLHRAAKLRVGPQNSTARGDLLSRANTIQLPPFPSTQRRLEDDIWSDFKEKSLQILGALLDGLVHAMREDMEPHTELPRMADFAVWVIRGIRASHWSLPAPL